MRRFAIPAHEDVAAALASLARLRRRTEAGGVAWLVAGHGRPIPVSDAVELLDANRQAIHRALAELGRMLAKEADWGGVEGEEPGVTTDLTLRWLQRLRVPAPRDDHWLRHWQRVATAYAREAARRRAAGGEGPLGA